MVEADRGNSLLRAKVFAKYFRLSDREREGERESSNNIIIIDGYAYHVYISVGI